MAQQKMLGSKVRRLRRERRQTQVELAERLGISASYLNLIEHNQRPLTLALLARLAEIYDIDLETFSADEEARLAAELQEAFSDPLFEDDKPTQRELHELVSLSPTLSRSVLALYRAYRSLHDDLQALADRLSGDAYLSLSTHELRTLLTSVRSFSEILLDSRDLAPDQRRRFQEIVLEESERLTELVDEMLEFAGLPGSEEGSGALAPGEEAVEFLRRWNNYFPALEEAAESLRRELDAGPGDLFGALAAHLDRRHGIAVETASRDGGERWILDEEQGRLILDEALPTASRAFLAARLAGLREAREAIEDILAEAGLSGPAALAACREQLARYFAGAVMMPYGPFHAAVRETRYDLELLQHRFAASLEQVCHRLTTLSRPGASGVPFHFLRIDIAGNISKRYPGSSLPIPRYGGACPRWNIHAAFMAPGKILRQMGRLPDGTVYFSIARTIRKPGRGFREPDNYLAVGLGCEIANARELVYADGLDLSNPAAAVPIGVNCRVCERTDCAQRAFPPLLHRPEAEPRQAAGASAPARRGRAASRGRTGRKRRVRGAT